MLGARFEARFARCEALVDRAATLGVTYFTFFVSPSRRRFANAFALSRNSFCQDESVDSSVDNEDMTKA